MLQHSDRRCFSMRSAYLARWSGYICELTTTWQRRDRSKSTLMSRGWFQCPNGLHNTTLRRRQKSGLEKTTLTGKYNYQPREQKELLSKSIAMKCMRVRGSSKSNSRSYRIRGMINSLEAVVPRDRCVFAAWLELDLCIVERNCCEVLHDDVREQRTGDTCDVRRKALASTVVGG